MREETADRLRCSPPEGIVEQALDMDILNERAEKPSEPDSEKTGRKLHTPTLGSLRVSGAPVDRLAQVDSALRGRKSKETTADGADGDLTQENSLHGNRRVLALLRQEGFEEVRTIFPRRSLW